MLLQIANLDLILVDLILTGFDILNSFRKGVYLFFSDINNFFCSLWFYVASFFCCSLFKICTHLLPPLDNLLLKFKSILWFWYHAWWYKNNYWEVLINCPNFFLNTNHVIKNKISNGESFLKMIVFYSINFLFLIKFFFLNMISNWKIINLLGSY